MNVFVNGKIVDLKRLISTFTQIKSGQVQWVLVGGICLDLIELKYKGSTSCRWHKDIDLVILSDKHLDLIGPHVLDEYDYSLKKVSSNEQLFDSSNIKIEIFLNIVPNFVAINKNDIESISIAGNRVWFLKPEFYFASQVYLQTSMDVNNYLRAERHFQDIKLNLLYLKSIFERTGYSNWITQADTDVAVALKGEQLFVFLKERLSHEMYGEQVEYSQELPHLLLLSQFPVKKVSSKNNSVNTILNACIEEAINSAFSNPLDSANRIKAVSDYIKVQQFTPKQANEFLVGMFLVLENIKQQYFADALTKKVDECISAYLTSGILYNYTTQYICGHLSIDNN